MNVCIRKIPGTQDEEVQIRCHEVTKSVRELEMLIKSRQERLEGTRDGRSYAITLMDIYYVEAVDHRVFAYLKDDVYQLKMKLYEFETAYGENSFFRCSKAVIINLMKIQSLKPALNGRFSANMHNGEEVIISRKFVGELKDRLQKGKCND